MTATTATATRKDPVLMEALVLERWHMLTLDTEISKPDWVADTDVSKWVRDIEMTLAYALARLCADGWEGDVYTRAVVERLMETICDELCKAAVAFRLQLSDECQPERAA